MHGGGDGPCEPTSRPAVAAAVVVVGERIEPRRREHHGVLAAAAEPHRRSRRGRRRPWRRGRRCGLRLQRRRRHWRRRGRRRNLLAQRWGGGGTTVLIGRPGKAWSATGRRWRAMASTHDVDDNRTCHVFSAAPLTHDPSQPSVPLSIVTTARRLTVERVLPFVEKEWQSPLPAGSPSRAGRE